MTFSRHTTRAPGYELLHVAVDRVHRPHELTLTFETPAEHQEGFSRVKQRVLLLTRANARWQLSGVMRRGWVLERLAC